MPGGAAGGDDRAGGRRRALHADGRLPRFVGFALANRPAGATCTVLGRLVAETPPPLVELALVFPRPIRFLPLPTGDARSRAPVAALACGASAGPLAHPLTPARSALAGGLAARILWMPGGMLAPTLLADRLLAAVAAAAVFFPGGRNLLVGVATGGAALVVLNLLRSG